MSASKFLLLAFLAALAIGCSTEQSSTTSNGPPFDGEKYILKAEPANARTPTEIKESVVEPTMVALAGRIDAGDFDAFQEGMASFIISQLPDDSHAEGDPDHADNCPFCKRKLKNAPKAIVRILDDSGEVKPVDARDLLGLSKGDVVVVHGLATYLEPVKTVQIDADGIFIR